MQLRLKFSIFTLISLHAAQGVCQTIDASAASRSALARTPPIAHIVRIATPPRIDGRLDEPAWTEVPAIDTFIQRDPEEGIPGSQPTTVRLAYDDEAIYVGARLDDGARVTTRLGRRDMPLTSSDWFRLSFDSYHDRRGGFRFDVNPSGVKRDATLTSGGVASNSAPLGGSEGDLAWDAVWEAATVVDAGGWTVEVRIPFTQLRFTTEDEQVWGLQIERIIASRQEHSQFSFTRKSEPGGVPAFGELRGLRGIRGGHPLELVPYVLSSADMRNADGNPFRGNRDLRASAGLDARYRLSSSLVLSATANPDFGQVEVDPAIINLSAFEVRLEEKRPFFVEGARVFKFGGDVNGPGGYAAALLYSRRIGRPPQIALDAVQADVPGVTRILGAGKVSGKTASGWSLGVLDAVTREERGRFVDSRGNTTEARLEPRSNYFTGRVNREFRRGMSSIGGIVTTVNRQGNDPVAAGILRGSAYAGGLDFTHDWDNHTWGLGGYLVGSRVAGTAESITLTQRSSSRYYQRPDSSGLHLDPSATSMAGYAGTVQLRKQSGLHWTGDAWLGVVSPGFEINDVGFLQRTDRIATGGALRYSERQPGRVFRAWTLNLIQNHTKNFDGDWIEKVLMPSAQITFLNYWDLDLKGTWERERIDDRLTRGGPLAIKPASWSMGATIGSDPRKPFTGGINMTSAGDRAGSRSTTAAVTAAVRTSARWNLSAEPTLTRVRQDAQYVTSVRDVLQTETFGTRYVFAPLRQTEASVVTRVNYTFTPDLSFEMYLQPLVSHADYGAPKEFATPSGYQFAVYGTDVGNLTRTADGYLVDPDGKGPAGAFSVPDRTFTTRSVRGSAVLRWEYRPGSTMFIVWQQERLNPGPMADFGVRRALGSLFDGDSRNVLAVKWTYRFNP